MKKSIKQKILFILLIFVLISSFSITNINGFGDVTQTIYGYVTDLNDVPIQGANVKLFKDGVRVKKVYTDSDGYYSLTYTGPMFALYYLKAAKEGYVTETRFVGWTPGSRQVDFRLGATFPMICVYKGYVIDDQTSEKLEGATMKLYKRFDDNDPWGDAIQTIETDYNGFYKFNSDTTELGLGYPEYKIEVTGICDKEKIEDKPSCSGEYSLNFYVTHPGNVKKYALIIGIARYNDFPWVQECFGAHNDALNWFEYFKYTLEYDADGDGIDDDEDGYIDEDLILILADDYYWPNLMPPAAAAHWFGPATESNIKWALNFFAQKTNENDFISIIFAGHAYSDDPESGSVYFASEEYDYNEPNTGRFYDTEYAIKVEAFKPYRVFTFIDTPHSEGFIEEIQYLNNGQYTFTSVACRKDGINYRDDNTPGVIYNGVWTYAFLTTIYSQPSWNIEDIQIAAETFWANTLFALGVYPPGKNSPTSWDGNVNKDFYLYKF